MLLSEGEMWIAVGVLYPITCLETCNVHSNTKGSFVRHPVASSVGAPGCSAAAIQMGKVSIGGRISFRKGLGP